jgi:AbiJ N-terminal domain 4
MPRFSERIGAVTASSVLQLDKMSDALRNSIWNVIHSVWSEGDHGWWEPAEALSQRFFKLPVDELSTYNLRRMEWIKKQFYGLPWYGAYDFMEYSAKYQGSRRHTSFSTEKLHGIFNRVLEAERSGYRFVAGELSPISAGAEIDAIDSAVATAKSSGLSGAHTHLQTALHLLGRRPNPDYRNSVKESISAVESVAKQLGGSSAQGLAGALNELNKQVPIHPALRAAFVKLYGYTSDAEGIRHAILDEPDVGFDEAKYMVVACSAFVYYLATKTDASRGRGT